ncbi:MAG TPA: hypothetical protein PLX03_11950, partial [Candidatus Hydrogenedentes bacterium]|nr:hypothetical protein [Candidatus Hydrogenedentota bacterium]
MPVWGRVKRRAGWVSCIALALMPVAGIADPPPLPEGLNSASDSGSSVQAVPPLPEGLNSDAKPADSAPAVPPLPEGLGSGSSSAVPALPEGLDSGNAAVSPKGDGSAQQAPPLPEGLGQSSAASPEKYAADTGEASLWDSLTDRENWHGFFDSRFGLRLRQDDAMDRDATLAESRFQLKTRQVLSDRLTLDFTGDVLLDGVLERAETDLRQFRLTWTPTDSLDIRLGRQPLAWGVGDLLFINDLFPKDWNSFFIGRDLEYLKAPSDAVKVGWFPGPVNVELVYTPQFDS